MNGIQHLFRQQAVDKQASVDSWHSANQSFMHPYANGRSGSPCNSNGDIKPPNWSQGKLPSSTCINYAISQEFSMLQIAFLTNFTNHQVHNQYQRKPSSHRLRNSAVMEVTARAGGSEARQIRTRWWWAEARTSWTSMRSEFFKRRHQDVKATKLNVSAAHRCPVIP